MRTCTKCKIEKPTSEFYKHTKYKDGLKTQCKECEGLADKERYAKAKAQGQTYIKNKQESTRRNSLKKKFGITVEQYEELLEKQDHRCAICKKHESEFNRRFAVDHAHTESKEIPAGMIRGLLCFSCNHLVVGRHTDSDIFENASKYLRQHTGWKVPEDMVKPKRKRRKKIVTRTKRKV
jgi:hypothetical protein